MCEGTLQGWEEWRCGGFVQLRPMQVLAHHMLIDNQLELHFKNEMHRATKLANAHRSLPHATLGYLLEISNVIGIMRLCSKQFMVKS